MPIGTKKRKKSDGMGDYAPNAEEFKAYHWGINNGIRIAPKPLTKGLNPSEWYVEIFANGKWNHSKEKFGSVDVWAQVYDYYIHYYNKRKL